MAKSLHAQRYEDFLGLLREKGHSSKSISSIESAWNFARSAHAGQKRASGEAYISHPLEVAIIVASFGLDETSIIAALLHDTIEDTPVTNEDLIATFGEEVWNIVDGVTKVSEFKLTTRTDVTVENLRKLILVMAKDLRVVLVKLADRLHNMRTLQYLSPEKQQKIARETLEIYAPLAERLGIGEIKGELEDLCFKYKYPDEYEKFIRESKIEYKNAEEHITKMRHIILSDLACSGVKASLHGRKKHYYSLWKKLARREIQGDYSKVLDIVALRIIVQTKEQCYLALGIVHSHYRPIPHVGISDFIAQPKPNGYRSIHTKVFGPGLRAVEIQIRTLEMHEQAEQGMAAHWHLSELKSSGELSSQDIDEGVINAVESDKLHWVKELVKWQEEIKDSKEFISAMTFDALNHRQFVFSPRGDIYDLPSGATPLDFAVAVHTDLLRYIKLVKVNGDPVSLNYHLKSGDIVEIVKSKKPRLVGKDWHEYVKTIAARHALAKIQSDR